ncbi:MAG: hypothetical protein ACRD1R_02835 [Acidobacteriota bacterium]
MKEEILRQTRRYLNRLTNRYDLGSWLSSRRTEILGSQDVTVTRLADELELLLMAVNEGHIPEGELRRRVTSAS